MRNSIKVFIFYITLIVCSPVIACAYVFFVIQLITYHRKSGVSSTALAPLSARYMQHKMGIRLDEPAVRLMTIIPHISSFRLIMAVMLLAHRLSGYVPGIYRYPFEGKPSLSHESAARTTFFDTVLKRHLDNIDQLVILGAGWDTRSYRVPERIRCFEVDAPKTQEIKRQMLKKVNLDTTRITFVPTDFTREDWLENLVNAGFDLSKPAFFLWEGVTPYLDLEVVESTLRKIAGTASGSVVAFDYFNANLIESQSFTLRYTRNVLKAMGEPFRSGIKITTPVSKYMAEYLASFGLSMEEQHNVGQETDRKSPIAGFTSAVVPAR
ncbi:MAG TPA: SAM-dependent methyltransferase [Ktedonobacteraceae bacterium]